MVNKIKVDSCASEDANQANSQEEWKPICKWETKYEVSSQGRVRSLDRLVRVKTNGNWGLRISRGKILKPYPNNMGYLRVSLRGSGERKMPFVHRLVMEAFHMNFDALLCCDHINGNPLDNNLSNLRLCTRSQNEKAFKKPSNGSSRYRGVSWMKRDRKWRARVILNGKETRVGVFHDEKEAAIAWNKAALEAGYFPEALNKI